MNCLTEVGNIDEARGVFEAFKSRLKVICASPDTFRILTLAKGKLMHDTSKR